MCFTYDDYAEFFSEAFVKVRKEQRCAACPTKIQRGELAKACSGKYEGSMFYYHVCGACELTTYRIHLHEIEEGCHWSESWICPEDLRQYCQDAEFELSSPEDGQRFCVWRREADKLRKERKRANLLHG